MHAEVFYDQIQPVGDTPIKILARIEVVKTEDGGRTGAFTQKYRPNHNFGSAENREFFIGQVEIPEGVWISPGETHDLVITFLNVQGLAKNLKIGRHWRIQEGSKLVANAEVLSVINAT